MEALVWSNLIATMLKRFICSSIEQFYQMEMSTLTVSKTTVYWWYSLLESIVNHKRKQLTDVLERTYFFLKENAGRAHPKRDKSTGLYQFGVEPNIGVTSWWVNYWNKMIKSLKTYLWWCIGKVACQQGYQKMLQANTIVNRTVLSFIYIAKQVINDKRYKIYMKNLKKAFTQLNQDVMWLCTMV